jgi:K+-sensing histidine kinase KdpD
VVLISTVWGAWLGGPYRARVDEGDDVAEVAARVARERGTTYVLMGVLRGRRGFRRLAEPLHDRLLTLLPGVDLRIVADRQGDGAGRER